MNHATPCAPLCRALTALCLALLLFAAPAALLAAQHTPEQKQQDDGLQTARKYARHTAFCAAYYTYVLEDMEYQGLSDDTTIYGMDDLIRNLKDHAAWVMGEEAASSAYDAAHARLGAALDHDMTRLHLLRERYAGFCHRVADKLPES